MIDQETLDRWTKDSKEAWHFLPKNGKLRFGKRPVLVKSGQTLKRDSRKLVLCKYGLHASIKPLDAILYAPGPIVCRVRMGGKVIHGDDKLVASRRTCLWLADADRTLRKFSRWCALQVIHLWDAPDVVKKYLETGDEKLRDAAWAAARAARDAAWAAARAAQAATWDATRAAARAAARDAKLKEFNAELEWRLLRLKP